MGTVKKDISNPCYVPNGCETHWNKDDPAYGYNSEYCDGIVSKCTTESPQTCRDGNPPLNTAGGYMGCTIAGDPNCKDFVRVTDQLAECSKDCWKLGGSGFANSKCYQLPTKETCEVADYFCEWVGYKCVSHFNDPVAIYTSNNGGNPPPPKFTKTKGDSSAQCYNNSFDPKNVTCVVQWPEGRVVIDTPRCQFVPDSNMCSFRKDGDTELFLCARTQFYKESTDMATSFSIGRDGFCTWCQNQSNTPKEKNLIPLSKEFRLPNEWDSGNRCTNYNECEIAESEKLYNSCIWEESSGKYGYDPNDTSKSPQTNGFCIDPNNEDHLRYRDICDKKLQWTTSSAEYTYTPPFKDSKIPSDTPKGNWVHECQPLGANKSSARNYYCTWCPSLRRVAVPNSLPVVIGASVGSGVGVAAIVTICLRLLTTLGVGTCVGTGLGVLVIVGVCVGLGMSSGYGLI